MFWNSSNLAPLPQNHQNSSDSTKKFQSLATTVGNRIDEIFRQINLEQAERSFDVYGMARNDDRRGGAFDIVLLEFCVFC